MIVGEDLNDGVVEVLAHGMLTSISVAIAAVKLLARDDLRADDRRRFADSAAVQLELVTDILREVARGLPPEALIHLRRGPRRPAGGAAGASGAPVPVTEATEANGDAGPRSYAR